MIVRLTLLYKYTPQKQGGQKQILDGYAELNSKKLQMQNIVEIPIFYYLYKIPKHWYSNTYPACNTKFPSLCTDTK